MKRVALLCLSLLLATALTLNASAFRGSGGRGGGGGVYRGGGGAGAIRGPGGGGAVRGPMGGGAAVGAAGGAAVRGPMGGGVARGSAGGAAVRGPMGGGVAAGPAGNVAVRGPAGNVAVGNTNVYRGSHTNVYGGAYPYYGYGAAAAGVAVGAAVGAAATAPYYYPHYPQPYYQTPCGPPYTPDTTNCEKVKERCMPLRLPHCLSAALAVCVLVPVAARAQVIPFGGNFGPGLAPSDNQMVFDSVARLNATEPSKVGQSDSWSNPETRSHGSSTILKVFHSNGMTCHLVRHHIVAARPPSRNYRLTWCRTASGEWKTKG